jgi:hypothetical protein
MIDVNGNLYASVTTDSGDSPMIEFAPPGQGKKCASQSLLPQNSARDHYNDVASRDEIIPIEAIPKWHPQCARAQALD